MRRLLAALFFLAAAPAYAAVITVTGTTDAGGPDGFCTLTEAIFAANTNAAFFECSAGTAGLDTIAFNVGGGGVQTITSTFGFPDITEPLNIDGTTQPGFAGTPLILVRGPAGPPFAATWGFRFTATAPGSTLRSIAMGGFLFPVFLDSSNSVVAGNYLGLDQTGLTAVPNQTGVNVQNGTGNLIGGPTAADRNVISGNLSTAIFLAFNPPGNVVQGNIIGLDIAGNPIGSPGSIGLQSSQGTRIIGNTIVGGGIGLLDSDENVVQDNELGVAAPVINGGIVLQTSDDNIIGAMTSGGPGGNTIANTTFFSGVRVHSGTGNSILTNSIYNIADLGIDLDPFGKNPNDACDADTGPNDWQNAPVLTRAIAGAGTATVIGSLNSTASSSYTIELFSNPTSDPEGRTFLGSAVVSTDGACNGTFTAALPAAPAVGSYVTATATDANGSTSEFSDSVIVIAALEVTKTFSPPSILRNTETSTLTITIENPDAATQSNVSFTDVYPAGLVNTALAGGDCGTVISSVGGGSLQLSNGTIAGGATCTITATVTSSTAGAYVNTLAAGSVTSSTTQNTSAASATLNVTELAAPAVTKTFDPPARRPGEQSLLTITFQNAAATPVTGLAFSDAYPAGLVNVTPLNVSSTCGGTVTATAGGGSLSLNGGTIPASGTCAVSVMVVINDFGTYVNTLPAGSIVSANAAPNAAPVSAVLSASVPIPTMSTWALVGLTAALALIAVVKRS